jgi:hypothetical protein
MSSSIFLHRTVLKKFDIIQIKLGNISDNASTTASTMIVVFSIVFQLAISVSLLMIKAWDHLAMKLKATSRKAII